MKRRTSSNNFLQSPVDGVVFQVPKSEFFVKNGTLLTTSAEKRFLPTAILEEEEVLGTAAFVLFVHSLRVGWARERNLPAIVIFFGFLITNLGEVTIFSMGGSGAFGWVMVGAAIMVGDNCWRSLRRRPLPAHDFRPSIAPASSAACRLRVYFLVIS